MYKLYIYFSLQISIQQQRILNYVFTAFAIVTKPEQETVTEVTTMPMSDCFWHMINVNKSYRLNLTFVCWKLNSYIQTLHKSTVRTGILSCRKGKWNYMIGRTFNLRPIVGNGSDGKEFSSIFIIKPFQTYTYAQQISQCRRKRLQLGSTPVLLTVPSERLARYRS